MDRTEIIKELIKDTGLSLKAFAEKANIPYTTLYSILDRGVGNAAVDNVIKICRTLEITIEELEDMAKKGKIEPIEPITIAAHKDGIEWTEEELEDIENFKKYVLSKRKDKDQ